MQPIDVHVHTNTQCNLKCVHCYEEFDETKGKMSITDAFEVSLVKYLCKNYDADIHLEGGELFLEERLIAALSILPVETLRKITVTSNGTIRLHTEAALQALRSIGCLRISVEGHTEDLHRSIRGYSLMPILDNAIFYKNQGIPMVMRITLNSLNAKGLFSETIPALESIGFNKFQIYEIQPVGRAKNSNYCLAGSLDDFFNDWLKNPAKSNVKVSLPNKRAGEVQRLASKLEQAGITAKNAGNAASISVGVDGSIRLCAWDMISKPLAFINEANLYELDNIIYSQNVPHICGYCSRVVLTGGGAC